MANKRLTVKSS